MKKCKGCGIELQTKDKLGIGYVVDMKQDYCQRCFRLSHYGDTNHLKTNYVTNEKIFAIYRKYESFLFVVIIDILDALCLKDDDLLESFKDRDVLLIINKTDLMPENISDRKIDQIFTGLLFDLNRRYPNIKAAMLTNKFENRFNDKFFSLLEEMGRDRVVFAGRANAGKSSLINKLIAGSLLTTSIYPGTTLDEVQISYKNHLFIDTPGLVDLNSYATHLNTEKYRLSKIDRTIKPQIFQLSEAQSYFYDGLLRVDVIPLERSSISFYISNDNRIHRTKYENGDDYYQKHYCEFVLRVKPLGIREESIDGSRLYVIKSLGMFKISGRCRITIHSLQNVKIYTSEVNL